MKKVLLFGALLFSFAASAQITVTNSVFPAGGDTLGKSVTINIGAATVTAPSATAQTWDFSFLTTDFYNVDSVRYAAGGASFATFPTTEIIVPILGFGSGYADVTTTDVTLIGGGLDLFGMVLEAPYANPQTLMVAPLTYNTANNDTHSLRFSEHIDSIPMLRQLIDSMGLPVSPDSIRLNLSGSTTQLVDAFGTCQLFDSTYNVLRQKTIIYNETLIEVWVPAFGSGFWVDVTSSVAGMLPFPLSDTTYRYDYIAEDRKVSIVRMNMDPSGSSINSMEFKGNNPSSSVVRNLQLTDVNVFPNPASEVLNLSVEGLNQFQVQVVSMAGQIVRQEQNLQQGTHSINIAELPQGQYFVLLRNEQGQLLARKAFAVAK